MDDAALRELIESLARLPVPAFVTDLRSYEIVAVNDLAAELFGEPADAIVGTDVLPRVAPRDREATRQAYAAMADKAVDGYQVQRRVVTSDFGEVTVSVCGRRIETPEGPRGLWMLIPVSEPPPAVGALMIGAADVVLAVTDHDWQLEYVSADATLLGSEAGALRGYPLLGLVHPSDATDLLKAAAQAAADRQAVTVQVRMRAGANAWANRYCLLVPVCEHDPPRLGMVLSAGVVDASVDTSPLDEYLRQAAIEARAARTLDALPAIAKLPPGKELTARQTEIVARLIRGQTQPEIAAAMYLSPSTVRNHLAATYRKFGVHSQSQLLAALVRASAEHG